MMMKFWKISSILPIALLVACTDYVGQVDEQMENLREELASVSSSSAKSSSSEKKENSSSSQKPGSSTESGSPESGGSSSEEQVESSSSFSCPVVEPTVRDGSGKVVVRFKPSWNNTSAVLLVNGVQNIMTAVQNYCGWFETETVAPATGFFVTFKQTVGNTYVTVDGPVTVASGEPPVGKDILLDSIAALSDTLWIVDNPNGKPDLYTCFPERLGECPVRTISVTMFDWLHGSYGDGTTVINSRDSTITYANGAKDQNPVFASSPYLAAYTVSNDFGSGGCQATGTRMMQGMVEPMLGENGVPKRNTANFPENCENSNYIDYWFLPFVVGQDAAGNQYTNVTCRSLELTLTDDGYWLAQKNAASPEGGFFFLDDFEYLDGAKTVKNIFFDQLRSSTNKVHNFGFTMKFQAKFEYVRGQFFEFKGDDDVWVFINNRLVVDIGGVHAEMSGAVDLDTLGLVEGEEYPFHIFYAERHTASSNFMMRTTIDLSADNLNGCP